jgi:hypothetical protein
MQRTNELKSWSFRNINQSNNKLPKVAKRKREKTQINKIRDEKGEMMTNTSKIHIIIGKYFENFHYKGLENLEEMGKFLDTCDPPKLNEEVNSLNRSAVRNETEAVIPTKKSPAQIHSLLNST